MQGLSVLLPTVHLLGSKLVFLPSMPTSVSCLPSSQYNRRANNNINPISGDHRGGSSNPTNSFFLSTMRPQDSQKLKGDTPMRKTNVLACKRGVRYRECRKNHAASTGGYAVDGCREFMAGGEEGTSGALKCAACSCHRSFHRREVEDECSSECSTKSSNKK